MNRKRQPNLKTNLEIGVKAIIENTHGLILIVKDATSGNWTLPGGRIRAGENIQMALIREIKEEVGLEVVGIDKPTSVWFFPAKNSSFRILLNCRCRVKTQKCIKINEECSDFLWVNPEEFISRPLPHKSLKYAILQEYNSLFSKMSEF